MSLTPCPVGRSNLFTLPPDAHPSVSPCATMLQPYRGRLTLGVAAHLTTVHGVPEAMANQAAASWVNSGGTR